MDMLITAEAYLLTILWSFALRPANTFSLHLLTGASQDQLKAHRPAFCGVLLPLSDTLTIGCLQ